MSTYFLELLLKSFIVFLICSYFYQLFIPILRKKLVDLPNVRSSHVKPTPTSGGIIFSIFGSVLSLIDGSYFVLLVLPLSIIGFLDDVKNVNPAIRFFFQVITVLTLLIFPNNSIFIPNEITLSTIFLYFIVIIAFAGIMNFVNFMDGIDGLVGGCMLIIIGFYCLNVNIVFWPFIPCLLAFLMVNWSPAKIFMGDSGSLFLGALYVILLLKAPTFLDIINLLIISSPLFIDAIVCLFMRIFYKQNIFKPHKSHLYQRMVSKGLSHAIVSSIYISSTIFLCIVVMNYNLSIKIICVFILFLLGLLLDKYFAISFKHALNLRN